MKKKSGGFSYIEVLIAISIFAVLLMASMPLINQASRNLAYAQDGYHAHLAAQSIMLAVRGEISEVPSTSLCITDAENAALYHAAVLEQECYSVWILDSVSEIYFGSHNAPAIDMVLSGDYFSENSAVIVVAIWDEHLLLTGRAIGVKRIK